MNNAVTMLTDEDDFSNNLNKNEIKLVLKFQFAQNEKNLNLHNGSITQQRDIEHNSATSSK